jgi:GT2 family glycosyltransferase
MDVSDTTLVIVPRERFSRMRRCLESVYQHLPPRSPVIVVDGASPQPLGSWLAGESNRRGFRLIRTEHLLTPNEARNLGGRAVDTPWMAFIDNDVLVSDGWLAALRRSAEANGAAMVAPITLEGEWEQDKIHDFGGHLEPASPGAPRSCRVRQPFCHDRYSQVRHQLRSGPADVLEFHAFLLRTDAFHQIGGMDENLLNTREHVDFSLEAEKRGVVRWVEKDAVITHLLGEPFKRMDFPYYLLRWNEQWNRRTMDYFFAKWGFAADEAFWRSHFQWLCNRRRMALRDGPLRPIRSLLRRSDGSYRRWAISLMDRMERRMIAPALRRREQAIAALQSPA